ncbi:monosaccharide ABC transporter substrate-binding protein (CUT2 family) [Anaerobacterium chartisolvens]|uniref:Monosaccharide ABC transporter substrate-binding protein (CUT2 family) n=1 Tax=Anaerobacterium chartisolvens TaxID=1297424 RepID=A0A369BB73_9FIRM|nr:substrate-binding domain-containing protein [Anaerobacterium chartisolvens]RCX18773.1 monosaccharide ABC transporter substrate-binding protein (CUT2 family) [Anaerobacterium chartisolvens]
MKNLFKVMALILALSMMLAACGNSAPSGQGGTSDSQASTLQDSDGGAEKVWKIGVTTQAWKHEFIKNLVNALKATDEQLKDVELTIIDSDDSVEKQLNDVDTLIAQGVDGIIMDANSFEGSSPAVEACKKAGIPLVELVAYTENEEYATFVGTDVKASGLMAGETIAELLGGKGKVLMIEGMMGHSGQVNRAAGITEALKKYPDIQMLDQQSGEWSKDKAMAVTENWLTKYPEIDAIVAHNDGMGLGAMNACVAAGRTEIKVVGIDGDTEALQGVIDGKYAASVLDDVWIEADLAVREMRDILNGAEPKKKIIVDYVPIKDAATAQKYLDQRK